MTIPPLPTRLAIATALLISGAVAIEAQEPDFATDDPVIRAIWDQGMTDASEVEWLAQRLLDSIGPRLLGSPANDAANAWVRSRYDAWGIANRAHEYGTWRGWVRGYSHIDLVAPRVRTLNGMMQAWSAPTDGPLEAEVVVFPSAISNAEEYRAWLDTVGGKIVMLSAPEPTCRAPESWEERATPESWERMQALQRETARANALARRASGSNDLPGDVEAAGAVAVVSANWSNGWGANKYFASPVEAIPGIQLSCEDYGLVHRLATNDQGPRLRLDLASDDLGQRPVFNIIAELPGTELPDEYVVLSAHLDSWDAGSGATDNGSGTVMMMEAMRILKAVYPNPRRTILVGHWGGEERGLIGSNAFAEDHPEVVEGLQANFNQDNGTWRIDFVRMQGFTGAGSHFGRWFSAIPDAITSQIELDIPGVPESGGSDHMAFICRLAPGFRLQSNYPDYRQYTWHTEIDTFDKLVFDDLRNNATLAAMLAYLASEDPVRMETHPREDARYTPCRTAPRSGG
ncbi:MAG: M20/M25/M40 family metallo-hydrolase [Longimicrobiales bacterium]|nr:M20/M25/M40 family metallo-hydrolase [Longimicrobiales bacterium]